MLDASVTTKYVTRRDINCGGVMVAAGTPIAEIKTAKHLVPGFVIEHLAKGCADIVPVPPEVKKPAPSVRQV